MKDLIQKFTSILSAEKITSCYRLFQSLEMNISTTSSTNSAKALAEQLEKANFKKIKTVHFPADGTPLPSGTPVTRAWECTSATLAIVNNKEVKTLLQYPDQVIAFSNGTDKKGQYYPVITELQMAAGVECRNALIVAETAHTLPYVLLKAALEQGAAGIIMENGDISIPEFSPAALSWYKHAGEKPFLGFLVSPEDARLLRDTARRATLTVFAQCDGHFVKGTLPLVTGVYPGKRPEELLILAPLPTPGDPRTSAAALAGAAALAEAIPLFLANGNKEKKSLPDLSLRIIAAPRAFLIPFLMDPRGSSFLTNAAGGIYLYSLPQMGKMNLFTCSLSPAARPFFVNSIMDEVLANGEKKTGIDLLCCEKITRGDSRSGFYAGGLPLIQLSSSHSLKARAEKAFSFSILRQALAYTGTTLAVALDTKSAGTTSLVDKLTTIALRHLKEASLSLPKNFTENAPLPAEILGEFSPAELPAAYMRFHLEKEFGHIASLCTLYPELDLTACREKLERAANDHISVLETKLRSIFKGNRKKSSLSTALDYCKGLIPTPHNGGFIPSLSPKLLTDLTANVTAGCDGQKSLCRLLTEGIWEKGGTLTYGEIKNLVLFLDATARQFPHIFTLEKRFPLGKKEIVDALNALGLRKGDTIMMHSALSPVGLIEGGADTVVDAFMEVLGEEGTLMAPVFSRPYTGFEGVHNKALDFRYFRKGDLSSVWTGAIGKTLAGKEGAITSAHTTHAWTGIGAKAEKCLSPHKELDPPTCHHSPLGMALREGGKLVYFGCKLSSSTFIHYLEDECNSIFLQNAFVGMEEEDGIRHTEVIHNHLPGHRDFYSGEPEKCKFFARAFKKGLTVRSVKLGLGEVKMILMEDFYRIGLELFREDPNVVLCEDPLCHFCRRFHK